MAFDRQLPTTEEALAAAKARHPSTRGRWFACAPCQGTGEVFHPATLSEGRCGACGGSGEDR